MSFKSANRQLAVAWTILLGIPIVVLNIVSPRWPSMVGVEIAVALLFAGFGPLVLYLRSTGRRYFYLSSAAIFWTVLDPFGAWLPIALAERLSIATPLADHRLAMVDAWAGLNVPAIRVWAETHRLGMWINGTYDWHNNYAAVAVVLLILFRKPEQALRMNLAFAIALSLAFPMALLCPAIGPWFIYQMQPDVNQQFIQSGILAYRASGGTASLPVGIIACPSFHVIIVLLNAWGLWPIKWLRVPAVLLSASIVVSTLTTASHYLIDVIMGFVVALVSIALVHWLGAVSERIRIPEQTEVEVEA